MKKLHILAIAAAIGAASCTDNKPAADPAAMAQKDSLESIIASKDAEINDIVGTLNEIEEGFRQINEAENRVNVAKDGEGTNKAQQIKENVKYIAGVMQKNRELIAKLKKQLSQSSIKGDQLQATIENMSKQLEEKEAQMQQLRLELDSKDIKISELDETVKNLSTDVTNISEESSQKSQTINVQDKQLNTAWYVFGTKDELKEQKILDGGKVLQSNFNKGYFTKVDIRNMPELKLYSKSAKLMTTHPSSSYTLAQDGNKQYVLRITNPQLFWSTSKYLVVLVK